MKKITLMLFISLLSWCGYSQLAQEGFEGTWPPTGWGVYDNGSGLLDSWGHTEVGNDFQPPYEGTYAAFIENENVPNTNPIPQDWLVTPLINVPNNPQLRFYSRLTINGDDGGLYRVMISTDADPSNLAAYTLVQEWTELVINPTQMEYIEVIVSLPAANIGQNVYLAFVMEGDNADRWLVDNVTVVEECLIPQNLNAANAGLDSADLTWDAGTATEWEVLVIPADQPLTDTGVPVSGTAEYSPTLTSDTEYKFYVKAICDEGNESEWSEPFFFSTVGLGDNCNAPVEITSLPYTTTDNTSNYGDNYSGIPGLTCVDFEWEQYLNGNDAVYSYTATFTGEITIDFNDTAIDAGIFVYDSCEDIGVDCLAGAIYGWEEIPATIPALAVTSGQTYYFVISSWGPFPQVTPYNLVIQQVACDEPVGLEPSNIGLTSVDLSWTNPSGATSWEIVVQAPGTGIPMGSGDVADTNTNFTVSPLTAATPYEYYVRADCGGGAFSAWAGPYLFNTTICDPVDQCTYTFLMSSVWGGWDGNTMTISQNGVTLAVIGDDFTWEDGTGPVEVTVQVCNGIPLDLFWNEGGWGPENIAVSIRNSFNQVFFTKPFNTGVQNSSLYTGLVDCDNPMCVPPTDLAAENITMDSADLSWMGTATGEWEYYVVEAGEPAPTDTSVGELTTTIPVTADELAPATNYEYYVRYVCSDTDSSDWAGPFAFHTEVCNPEDKCVFTFEMTSANGWGWEGNTMTIFQAGVPIATIGETFTWGPSAAVDIPLCDGEEIEIVWNLGGWGPEDKGLIVYSPFAEDIFFKPPGTGAQGTTVFTGPVSCDPPPCPKPQDLSVSDVQLTSAMLDWVEMGSATTWEVWVLPYGSPAPTTPGEVTDAHPFLADELESGTAYVFYVRANCGDVDGYSTWSGPFTFVTAIENDDCAGATTVPVNTGIDCVDFANGTISGATSSGVMASCNWQAPTYDVWFEFVATESTHTVAINNMVGVFLNMNIYGGTDCGTLTELYCGWDTTASVSGLVVGQTYYVQVFTDWLNNPAAPTSFEVCVVTPSPIIADNTTYTVEELVQQVLVTSTCAQVSNITWTTGTSNDWADENGIAMFNKGMSDFPLNQGVILSTGNAMSAPGPNTNTLGEGFWPGDDDLFNYIQASGIDPGLFSYNNATVLEFDFVPLTDHMTFPFIFASEEYGTFQCSYSDAFAFFLTNTTAGTPTENLAVIPGTDIPVSVTTIRDNTYNSGCDSQNVTYFDTYYEQGDMGAAINFNGHTVQMVAESDVVIGDTYHIKLVIADRNDSAYDSAVFIGPFDIGDIDLGIDMTVGGGNAICPGEERVINSNLDPEDYAFTWFYNDVEIEGETGASITVSEAGEYTINAQYLASTCAGSDSIMIEYYPTVGDPIDLTACDSSGFDTFDLSQNTGFILAGMNAADYAVTYHATIEDAQAGTGTLDLNYTNTTAFQQTIYVRIVGVNGCVETREFALIVQDTPPQFTLTEDFSICEGAAGTIAVEAIDFDPATATYTWTLDGGPLAETTQSISATSGGIYEVTVNNTGCTATQSVTVTFVEMPVADVMEDVTSCGSFVLPDLSANNGYYTGAGGTGEALAAGSELTANQMVYIYSHSDADFGDCTDESSFMVTVVPAPEYEIAGDCIGNEYILQVNFLNDVYNEGNVTFEWTDPDGITFGSDSASVVALTQGTYEVSVIPDGFDESCPFLMTFEADNVGCMIPKGVSPNNDAMNDRFDLDGFNVTKLSIFNRYGQEVYSRSNYTDEWFGQTDSGDELPSGTYFYSMERANGESKTGWVYVNRQEN